MVAIENPHRSWLWMLIADMLRRCGKPHVQAYAAELEHVVFDQCMHGSDRDKRTKLLSSPSLFSQLAIDCDNSHEHASWTPFKSDDVVVYPTAAEAEYPRLLAQRMAACLLQTVHSLGLTPHIHQRLKDLLTYNLGAQKLRHPPLITEYRDYAYLDQPVDLDSYKLLASPIQGANTETSEPCMDTKRFRIRHTYKYGILRDPLEFLSEAKQVQHPVDSESFLHEATKEAIKEVVSSDPVVLAKKRLQVILNLRKLADELKPADEMLKESMSLQVLDRVRSKNIALFRHILQQLQYEDMGVVDLVASGVPLVGMQEAPPGYKPLVVPATMTQDELEASALWRRKSLMSPRSELDEIDEEELVSAAKKEVELGFLAGPYTEAELDQYYGHQHWLLNPRFALHQGIDKIRVIDDAKASSLNAGFSSTFKLQLQDTDYVAAMVRATRRTMVWTYSRP